ncbi:unknown [Clostridium sp. CAG:448]|nr:unknown [Clostridium sp. CAG:448]
MAVGGENGRFVVAKVTESVGGKLTASHCTDQSGNFPCTACHQCTFECPKGHAVKHAGGDADNVFGCCSNLVSDQVIADIETNQIARKGVNQMVFGFFVLTVNDHAVRNPGTEGLYMPGTEPHRNPVAFAEVFRCNLGQAATCRYFDSLHAEHNRFAAQPTFCKLTGQSVKPL